MSHIDRKGAPPRDLSYKEAAALYSELGTRARRRRRVRASLRGLGVALSSAILVGVFVAALVALGPLRQGKVGPVRAASGATDCTAATTQVVLTATSKSQGLAPGCVSAPVDEPFAIYFTSSLEGSNGLAIFSSKPDCTESPMPDGGVSSFTCDPAPIFLGDPVNGPGSVTYEIGPLAAGTYYLQVDNPANFETVVGTLLVE